MGTRFAPGGSRPAPATVYAAPRSEIFPGIERPTIVLWLGLALILASEAADGGPIRRVISAAAGGGPAAVPEGAKHGLAELAVEIGLVAFLYVLALASDESGTLAVLILIALWLVWIVRHPKVVISILSIPVTLAQGKG